MIRGGRGGGGKKKALRKTDSGNCLDYFSPFKSTELLMLHYKKYNFTVKDSLSKEDDSMK